MHFKAFNANRRVPRGVFRFAEFVSEVYISIRLHAHAQERIFTHFKAFNAKRRVPRGFLESLSSFPRSIYVYDDTRMRRRGLLCISKLLTQIGGYLGSFSNR